MAAMAYMLEKAVLRSIRRSQRKPTPEQGPMARRAGTNVSR